MVNEASLTHVFVYGTLKPGECNYQKYCAERVVQVRGATARGQLFALPLGYPAMTVGAGIVQGVSLPPAEARGLSPSRLQCVIKLSRTVTHPTCLQNRA